MSFDLLKILLPDRPVLSRVWHGPFRGDSLLTPRDKTNTLIKIDVDGPEVDTMEASRSWADFSNLFVIEVHHEQFIAPLGSLFAEQNLRLILLNQRPLPGLGRETRPENNCWLVSDLSRSRDQNLIVQFGVCNISCGVR